MVIDGRRFGVRQQIATAVVANAALVALPAVFSCPPWASLATLVAMTSLACAVDVTFTSHVGAMGHPRATSRNADVLDSARGAALLITLWVGVATTGLATTRSVAGGCALMLLGVGLRFAAHRSLGEQFRSGAVVAVGDRLITSGAFSWMRHPSDTGIVLLALGAATVCASAWAGAVAVIVLAPLAIARARLDDRVLAQAFGAEFERYRGRVPAVLPHVVFGRGRRELSSKRG